MKVATTISYRVFQDLCIVIDHASQMEMELNVEGGQILERIERGEKNFSVEELQFIEQLKDMNVVVDQHQSIVPLAEEQMEAAEETDDNSIYGEIKDYARENLLPISCLFEVTHRCRLKCRHCYLRGTKSDQKNEMTLEEIKRFLEEYKELGGTYLTFTGGDPFVRTDFWEIFSYARKLRFAVTILTSAFKVDEALLIRFAQAGIYYFQVSIYGPNAKVHDDFTGIPGSFDDAIRALRLMQSYNVAVRASLSIVKDNVDHFEEIISMLVEMKIPYGINYIMNPRRNGDFAPVEMSISDQQLRKCLTYNSALGVPNLRGKGPNEPVCDCARSLLSIDPYGNVYPCMELRDEPESLRDQSLSQIWHQSPVFQKMRQICLGDLEDCLGCQYKEYCNRCSANALKDGKELCQHSQWDCRYAKFLHEVIEK